MAVDRSITIRLRVASAEFDAAMAKAGTEVRAFVAEVDKAGADAGNGFAGSFDKKVKEGLDAALKSLPVAKITADSTDADRRIFAVRGALAELSGKTIGVDVSEEAALAKLKVLRAELETLTGKDQTVKVRTDASSATKDLKQLETVLGGSGGVADGMGKLSKAAGDAESSFSGLSPMAYLVAAGVALIGPAAGAAAAGLFEAGGAAAVAFLAYEGINQEMAAGTPLGRQFKSVLRDISGEFHGLETAAGQGASGGVLSALMQIKQFLPTLEPYVMNLSQNLGRALNTSTTGIIAGLRTMEPLLNDAGGYANKLAQEFASFMSSNQFRSFVDYARQELPVVLDATENVGKALVEMGVAFAPVGTQLVQEIDGLGRAIDDLHVDKLSAVASIVYGGDKSKGGILGAISGAAGDVVNPFGSLLGDLGGKKKNPAPAPTSPNTDPATAAMQQQQAAAQALAGQYHINVAAWNAATTAQQNTAAAAQAAAAQMFIENDAGGLLKQALDALDGKAIDAATAQNQFEQAIVSMTKKVTKGGAELDGMSAAAVTNRGELLNLIVKAEASAEAFGSMDKSGEKTRLKLIDLRQQIIDAAVATGENRAEVTKLIDSLLKIPKGPILTRAEFDAQQAKQKVHDLLADLALIPAEKYVQIQAVYGGVANASQARDIANNRASGGAVIGPGTATSDSIPAHLSNGEHVLTASDVAAMGGQSAVYAFRSQLHGHGLSPMGVAAATPVRAAGSGTIRLDPRDIRSIAAALGEQRIDVRTQVKADGLSLALSNAEARRMN